MGLTEHSRFLMSGHGKMSDKICLALLTESFGALMMQHYSNVAKDAQQFCRGECCTFQ